ncbi:MAG: ribbon-helix-helix domain-containing protein [Sulfolobaceae archaeon]|nr:ribbon-helix-helix domain-containing protein [Sulfolobales archaeon]
MTKSVVSFRLPEEIVIRMDELVNKGIFASRKDVVMNAVKEYVEGISQGTLKRGAQ